MVTLPWQPQFVTSLTIIIQNSDNSASVTANLSPIGCIKQVDLKGFVILKDIIVMNLDVDRLSHFSMFKYSNAICHRLDDVSCFTGLLHFSSEDSERLSVCDLVCDLECDPGVRHAGVLAQILVQQLWGECEQRSCNNSCLNNIVL